MRVFYFLTALLTVFQVVTAPASVESPMQSTTRPVELLRNIRANVYVPCPEGKKSYTRSKSLLWTDDKSIKHPSPSIISYSVTQSSRSIFFPLPRGEFIIFACPFFSDSGVLDLLSCNCTCLFVRYSRKCMTEQSVLTRIGSIPQLTVMNFAISYSFLTKTSIVTSVCGLVKIVTPH